MYVAYAYALAHNFSHYFLSWHEICNFVTQTLISTIQLITWHISSNQSSLFWEGLEKTNSHHVYNKISASAYNNNSSTLFYNLHISLKKKKTNKEEVTRETSITSRFWPTTPSKLAGLLSVRLPVKLGNYNSEITDHFWQLSSIKNVGLVPVKLPVMLGNYNSADITAHLHPHTPYKSNINPKKILAHVSQIKYRGWNPIFPVHSWFRQKIYTE